jgi:hypothetical protein
MRGIMRRSLSAPISRLFSKVIVTASKQWLTTTAQAYPKETQLSSFA